MTAGEVGAGAGLGGEREEGEAQNVCRGPVKSTGRGYPPRMLPALFGKARSCVWSPPESRSQRGEQRALALGSWCEFGDSQVWTGDSDSDLGAPQRGRRPDTACRGFVNAPGSL